MTIATVRSIKERILHACIFEFFAIFFTLIIGILLLNKPLNSMGIVSVLISLTALLLNIVFNWIFDKLFPFVNGNRPVHIRLLHAIGFEATLVIFTIPMIAYILNMSFFDAFIFELGLLIFFFFYTYIYNWLYDQIRKKIVARYATQKK